MGWDDVDDVADAPLVAEWKLRAIAVPAALILALIFHASSTGHFLQRTFLSMMVHECGHAVTAWWCGIRAIPTLWKTLIAFDRSAAVALLVATFNVYLIVRGVRARRFGLAAVGGVLAVLQLGGTLALSTDHAQMWICFGGDGGAMVLGTLLMCCFFVDRESRLHRGGARWGLLVIGAGAVIDTFATWWTARADPDSIPFGEIEGVGQSDPSKLTEQFGWTTHQLVSRYVTLGVICLVVLGAVWLWNVRRAWLTRTPPSG